MHIFVKRQMNTVMFCTQISISLDAEYGEAFDPTNPSDVAATDRFMQVKFHD